MDKYDAMLFVENLFEGLKSEEEIEARANNMINVILQYKEMAKGYLEAGIL